LQFARAHINWIVAVLEKVLWSDESKCNLLSSHCIRYTRRHSKQRFNVRYQVPTVKHGMGNVMLWGSFSKIGEDTLIRIDSP